MPHEIYFKYSNPGVNLYVKLKLYNMSNLCFTFWIYVSLKSIKDLSSIRTCLNPSAYEATKNKN